MSKNDDRDRESSTPIKRLLGNGPFPASSTQARLWFLNQLYPDQVTYNVWDSYRLQGALNISALAESLTMLVERHEALRTSFVPGADGPEQFIQQARPFELEIKDLSHLPQNDRAARWRQLAREFVHLPFNLQRDLLLRGRLYRLDEKDYRLLLVEHHIATDGWSRQIMCHELEAFYRSIVNKRPSPLPPLPYQFKDYAAYERSKTKEPAFAAKLAYWEQKLAGMQTFELRTDYPRQAVQQSKGNALFFNVQSDLMSRLKSLAHQEGAPTYRLLLSAFFVLLHRYSSLDDIGIGTPIANRADSDSYGLMGFFANTVILRASLAGNPTFREFLHQVSRTVTEALDHQDVPFDQVIEALRPERNLSLNPLFQIMFQADRNEACSPNLEGLKVDNLSVDFGIVKFDMEVRLRPGKEGYSGIWRYQSDLYKEETIQSLCRHFILLLEEIAADPDLRIDNLSFLTPQELERLAEWNETDTDYSYLPDIATQFYNQVSRCPENTAFVFGDQRITFKELNERSNQLARYLMRKGVRQGVRVGLALERSLEIPVALLAIIKARGVYVPLDTSYPAEHLRFIVEDSDLQSILTAHKWQDVYALYDGGTKQRRIIYMDAIAQKLEREARSDILSNGSIDDSLYIVYTSGSLGKPKGIEHKQKQLLNRLGWLWERYPVLPDEAVGQKTAISFVDSIGELFICLLKGATTIIIPDQVVRDPYLFVDTLSTQKVTRLFLTPSYLRVILETHPDLQERLPYLRFWVCSAEPLPSDLAQRFKQEMPQATHCNAYGTSEVYGISWYEVDSENLETTGGTVPIGRPYGNMRTYVVDSAQNLAPVGVPGELWVSGACLTGGYIGRPDLTAERFLSNPFKVSGNLHRQVYRTGDLVRQLPDGNLEHLGRVDRQIKIRGMRIEPGGVEAHLRQHAGVADAAVIVRGHGDGQQLVAFITALEAGEELPGALKDYLTQRLPAYMMPNHIVVLEAFPKTPSGKINHSMLAEMEIGPLSATETYLGPRTANEEKLVEIWEEVLDVKQVGVHDDFFVLGGHSLVAMSLISRIEEHFTVRLPLSLIFEAPTIADLARRL